MAWDVLVQHYVTLPRQVLPDKFHMVNRRCTQGQFLMRPDRVTNQTFAYCLGLAAQETGVQLLFSLAMSNHHHTPVYDSDGNVSQFMQLFHGLFARALNAHRGRWEYVWSSEQPCVVELEGVETVIEKIVYAATNPVKAGLVAKARDWPGFTAYEAFLSGAPMVVQRPAHFFRDDGETPHEVKLEFKIPEHLGNADEIRAEVRRRIAAVEKEQAAKRRGRRVLGAAAVRRQNWRSYPHTRQVRRGLRPRVASRWKWRRIETLQRNKQFQFDYREAYRAWRAGDLTVVFPTGTYWLARFAHAVVAKNC